MGRLVRRALGAAALTLAGLAAALMLLPPVFGLQRYVVTGSSMSGTYDRGSIVLADVVPVRELRPGDVVTYAPPRSTGIRGLVTHRIAELRRDRSGRTVLRTQGDANAEPDPWTFTLPAREQARVVAGVPYVGWGIAALGIRPLRMALIGGPALLIALGLVVGLWREARAAAAREPARPRRA